jgi:hypothetical protein
MALTDHSGMRRFARCLVLVATLFPAACGGPNATPTLTGRPAATDAAGIVWLCKPGLGDNPCTGDLSVTVIDPNGKATVADPQVAKEPPIDCFYVYPTTSRQETINADLSIDPEEKAVATAQAALFSQVCDVYAPIYPQLTIHALNSGAITQNNIQVAYEGVRAAFADYMAKYNHGRGIIFIGHSQGAMMLTSLLHYEVDPNPELRKQLVSALLMGGNVTVPVGQTMGGDFARIPACESAVQVGCVVAYSSFDTTPPANAAFGRVGGALGMFDFGETGPLQILCVNPALPDGGAAALKPYFPTAEVARLAGAPTPTPATPYISYPGEWTAQCKTDGDGSWLQITRTGPTGATPAFSGSEGPSWGLHDLDVSLALGNLIELVRSEAAAYRG